MGLGHQLSQWWLQSATCFLCSLTGYQQNGRDFASDIFECNLSNENFWILNKIQLKYVHCGLIDDSPALVQIIAWRRRDDQPLSEPMLPQIIDAYMRHSALMSQKRQINVDPSSEPMLTQSVLAAHCCVNSWKGLVIISEYILLICSIMSRSFMNHAKYHHITVRYRHVR